MDDWKDLKNVLSFEQLYDVEFPLARADAQVTIESLPTELLAQVVNYSKNKSVLSLMRVNRLFYSVALRKFYATVYLPGGSFAKLLRPLAPTLSAEELLPSLYHKKFGILGGLLHSKHHISVLKELHIISFPSPLGTEHTIFNKLLRYIVENATSINEMHLPFANITPSVIFDGLVVPPSLGSLNSPIFRSDLVNAILNTGKLRSLWITFQCASLEEWQTVATQMPLTLRHLECSIHVPQDQWDESVARMESFASKLSRLETLKFGYCDCFTAATPRPEALFQNYVLLATATPSLTCLTIIDCRHGSFQRREDILQESTLVSALSHANHNLCEISVYYMYRSHNFDGEKTITWKAASPTAAEGSRDVLGHMRLWTPAPRFRSRWRFWSDTFGDAQMVLKAMKLRWSETAGLGEETNAKTTIPRISDLERFLNVTKSLEIIGHEDVA